MVAINKILIPHSRPTLGEEEAAAAAAVVRSGHVAQGPIAEQFERELAARCGRPTAAVTGSGTAGLYLALRALDTGPGREVVIPSYVCSALLNAVRMTGAEPVLADVEPRSGNIDPLDVRRKLTKRSAAIIVAHLFGRPAPVDEIVALGVPVIEDCAQAIGADIGGRPVGSFGELAVFSFYATKVITTGEGGAVAGDRQFVERVRDLCEYDNKADGRLRFNFKMSDIQAAVGKCQLRRLDGFIERRRTLVQMYLEQLQGVGRATMSARAGEIHYRFVVDAGETAEGRAQRLRSLGIGAARPVFRPLHRLLDHPPLAGAEEAWEVHLSLPIYPSLQDGEIDTVIEAMRRTAAPGEFRAQRKAAVGKRPG